MLRPKTLVGRGVGDPTDWLAIALCFGVVMRTREEAGRVIGL